MVTGGLLPVPGAEPGDEHGGEQQQAQRADREHQRQRAHAVEPAGQLGQQDEYAEPAQQEQQLAQLSPGVGQPTGEPGQLHPAVVEHRQPPPVAGGVLGRHPAAPHGTRQRLLA
ncbi:hypothetical protein ACFQX8_28900 [Klenkia terrae]|uniref:hypothetical protein n=1 Tax=Klenkia terrae TaxID=1052259 RepID=UPI00361EA145